MPHCKKWWNMKVAKCMTFTKKFPESMTIVWLLYDLPKSMTLYDFCMTVWPLTNPVLSWPHTSVPLGRILQDPTRRTKWLSPARVAIARLVCFEKNNQNMSVFVFVHENDISYSKQLFKYLFLNICSATGFMPVYIIKWVCLTSSWLNK